MNSTIVLPSSLQGLNRRISIAPMMDYTDRYDRFFLRLMSHHVLLYTEMVTAQALIRGDKSRFLQFDPTEHPVALQLGGSEPADLAVCARVGEDWGYDEINLNVGCPSERVSSGRFGACLMAEPALVGDCVAAMRAVVKVPVTVKCRIGIDNQDRYEDMVKFVATVAQAGCDTFIVHARKAWLQGLSPKENREIPPLRYREVYQLKREFPNLNITINGGIKTYAEIDGHLSHVDGVMIGREAYHNPYLLAEFDRRYFGADTPIPSRAEVIDRFLPFVERELAQGVPVQRMTRHILGLFHGVQGAGSWKRYLSQNAHQKGVGTEVIKKALLLATAPIDLR